MHIYIEEQVRPSAPPSGIPVVHEARTIEYQLFSFVQVSGGHSLSPRPQKCLLRICLHLYTLDKILSCCGMCYSNSFTQITTTFTWKNVQKKDCPHHGHLEDLPTNYPLHFRFRLHLPLIYSVNVNVSCSSLMQQWTRNARKSRQICLQFRLSDAYRSNLVSLFAGMADNGFFEVQWEAHTVIRMLVTLDGGLMNEKGGNISIISRLEFMFFAASSRELKASFFADE